MERDSGVMEQDSEDCSQGNDLAAVLKHLAPGQQTLATHAHAQAAAVGGMPVADFWAFDSMRPPAYPLLLRTSLQP